MKHHVKAPTLYTVSDHHYHELFRRRFIRTQIRAAVFLLAAGAVSFFACDKDDDTNNYLSNEDRNFAVNAGVSNTAEIRAGQLAATKATDAGIRAFGQMMVNDHQMVQTELKEIGSDLGVHVPDSLDAEHVALEQQLMNSSGRMFDSIYIHSQVKDHQKAIDLFQNQANNGSHWQLKNYASTHLPHLQMHHHKADSLAASYK